MLKVIVFSLLLSLLSTSYGFHIKTRTRPFRRECQVLQALDPKEDGYDAWYNKVVGDGPGHVSSTPFNTAERAREDLVKIVLGIAVVWLGMKVKVQAALAATSTGEEEGVLVATEEAPSASSNLLLDESSGEIQYVDLLKGTTSVEEGQTVNIRTRYFHNGMQIDFEDAQENNRIVWNHKNLQEVFTSSISDKQAMQDLFTHNPMNPGGRRQLTFPCNADVGPYVKEGGLVLCDIVVERV